MKKHFVLILIAIVIVIIGVGLFFRFINKKNTKPASTNLITKSETTETSIDRKIKVLSSGETIGHFEGIEWGDYCHFMVKDLNGENHGFFIYINSNRKLDIEGYGKDPINIGKKVKVKWQDIETYIPEGGGNYTIRELIDFEEIE